MSLDYLLNSHHLLLLDSQPTFLKYTLHEFYNEFFLENTSSKNKNTRLTLNLDESVDLEIIAL